MIAYKTNASKFIGKSTSLTIDNPDKTVGNVSVAFIGHDRAKDPTVSIPDGWTTLFEHAYGSTYYGDLRCYYHVVGDSEPDSYTWVFTNPPLNDYIRGTIIAFSGVDNTNPISAFNAMDAGNNTAATTMNSPAISQEQLAGSYVLRAVAAGSTNTPTMAITSSTILYADSFKRPILAVAGSPLDIAGPIEAETWTATTGSLYRPAAATVVLNPIVGKSLLGSVPFVYNGTEWKEYTPYTYLDSSWAISEAGKYE